MKATKLPKGEYHYNWDASTHPSGMYFVRIVTDSGQQTYKLVKSIQWDKVYYRTDIGYRAIERENA